MTDRWEAGGDEVFDEGDCQALHKHESQVSNAQCEELQHHQSQLQKLEEEQAMYQQLPQPPMIDNCSPTTIPENMNYPTQFGKSTSSHQQQLTRHTQTTTSVTCYTTEYKTMAGGNCSSMQPAINIPITCCCTCRRKRRCKCKKRREPSPSMSSRVYSDSSRSVRKSSSKSFRFCDEDYFSADSDSDLEQKRCRSSRKLGPKKAKSNIRKRKAACSVSVVQLTTMTPEQCMMLKVMEQMMTILCRMDDVQRGHHVQHEGEDSSIKTLYQSRCTGEESKSTPAYSDRNVDVEGDEDENKNANVNDNSSNVNYNNSKSTVAPSVQASYRNDLDSQNFVARQQHQVEEEDEDEAEPEDFVMPYKSSGSRHTQDGDGHGHSQGHDTTGGRMVDNGGMPILVITFDPETCMPCCCVHNGPLPGPCQEIPVFEIKSCNSAHTQQQPFIMNAEEYEAEDMCIQQQAPVCDADECICTEETETRFELRIHDHVQVVRQENFNELGAISEDRLVEITMGQECEDEDVHYQTLVCEATQTEGYLTFRPMADKSCQEMEQQQSRSIVSMDAVEGICEEFYSRNDDSSSAMSNNKSPKRCKVKGKSKQKSKKPINPEDKDAAGCDCCHCRAEREAKDRQEQQEFEQQRQQSMNALAVQQPTELTVLNSEDCKHQLKSIVDSIITDLECMEKVRRRMNSDHQMTSDIVPKFPPQHARQSFPVTIVEVCELGLSSLYVKWVIHDCYGIGGYEIYVDGYLTNRYYNARHEAAVICDVDVSQSHKVCLVAKPKAEKALLGAGDLLDDDFRPPVTPSSWAPSIFLYEPSSEMDCCKRFR